MNNDRRLNSTSVPNLAVDKNTSHDNLLHSQNMSWDLISSVALAIFFLAVTGTFIIIPGHQAVPFCLVPTKPHQFLEVLVLVVFVEGSCECFWKASVCLPLSPVRHPHNDVLLRPSCLLYTIFNETNRGCQTFPADSYPVDFVVPSCKDFAWNEINFTVIVHRPLFLQYLNSIDYIYDDAKTTNFRHYRHNSLDFVH